MRCPKRAWQAALIVLMAGVLMKGRAREVYNMSVLLLANTGGRAWGLVRASPAAISPLHASMLNVTSDYSQLAHLVSDFLHQPGVDPELEQRFKEYLADRAAKSYPRLETALDWLLAIYKFLFPFLIISLVAKLQSNEPPCPEPAPTRGAGSAAERAGSYGAPGSELALLGASGKHGGSSSGALDRRRQRAVGGAGANGPAGGDSSSSSLYVNGSANGRAGSQSPSGPDTPVEGNRLLAPQPVLRQTAGGLRSRQQATIREISAF